MTSIPDLAEISAPRSQSILKVELKAEQNFGETGVKKVVVPFKREEDMILMCLSIFLHDFVHDYNLSSMHKRVIKGESYELLQKLNIGIRNPTFKIFAYETGSFGNVSLYDDSKFEDVEQDPGSKPVSYLEYFHENGMEMSIPPRGGRKVIDKPFQVKVIGESEEQDDALEDINSPAEFKLKEEIKRGLQEEEPESEMESDKETQSLTSEVETSIVDILSYPLNSTFVSSETYKPLIEAFSNNADFLGFHSGLNTFVVTYLGSNDGSESPEFLEKFKPDIDSKSDEMKNLAMYNSILCSMDCVSADFKKASLTPNNNSLEYSVFCDIFSILRLAYVTIFNKTNGELKLDSLEIMNSNAVLQQFIIFYMLFLNCEHSEEFNAILQKQSGGQGGEEGEEEEEEVPLQKYTVLGKPRKEVEIRQYPGEEVTSAYYARPEKRIYLGSESIFITHNNLLTTLARGMFVKLGLWDKIFSGIAGYSESDGSIYTFGIKEIDIIGYDKLMELFPTNPWKGGQINNELLIMQILVLKNLLIEMSPSKTMTFGAKIDDQLKNYLDVFYNSHFVNKNQKTDKPPPKINEDVFNNPDPNEPFGPETESLFSGNEEQESDVNISESDDEELTGGNGNSNGNGEIEMVELNKPTVPAQPKIESSDEELDLEGPFAPEEIGVPEEILQETEPVSPFPDSEIINPGRTPGMPIVFKNLKKMFQNSVYTMQNLQSSRINPIDIPFGTDFNKVYTLYELLSYNQTLMHRTGSQFNIPAPAFKFVINNAANISANINGSKFLYTKKDREEIQRIIDEVKSIPDFSEALESVVQEGNAIAEKLSPMESRVKYLMNIKRQNKITIREYNELLKLQFDIKTIRNTELIPCENKKYLIEKVSKLNSEQLKKGDNWLKEWIKDYKWWLQQSQPLFGLYRNLVRATFCPTASMMDAMFNCSLKYGASETKEVGTMNFELKYESQELDPKTQKPVRVISYGGVVLNYNETVAGIEQLNAKIDFDFTCIDTKQGVLDIANISTIELQVAESHDLKASVVYKSIVDKIKQIYSDTYGISPEEDTAEAAGVNLTNPEAVSNFLRYKIDRMWSNTQVYRNVDNFNRLLSSTAIKTFGDYLQECLACIKWGGYVNSVDEFPDSLKNFIREKNITPIYRSVSEPNKIIPYDKNGNALRFGIQGDRPSGFRSIYILMNGDTGINQQAITGYLYTSSNQKPSRSIIVARNSGDDSNNNSRKDGLRGKVIYTTRELPIIQEDRIRYLRSLQYKKITEKKTLKDKTTGEGLVPEIKEPTIQGTSTDTEYKIIKPPSDISYMGEPYKTSNYELWDDYETPRVLNETKNKVQDFIDPQEAAKAEEKAIRAEEKIKEKTRIASEKALEKTRLMSDQQGMKGEDAASKEIRKATNEINEKHQLLAKPDKTPVEKRRYTALEKKYPGLGGSKRRKVSKGLKITKRNRKNIKKRSFKKKINKKHKYSRRFL
jgi:hypothetical protein